MIGCYCVVCVGCVKISRNSIKGRRGLTEATGTLYIHTLSVLFQLCLRELTVSRKSSPSAAQLRSCSLGYIHNLPYFACQPGGVEWSAHTLSIRCCVDIWQDEVGTWKLDDRSKVDDEQIKETDLLLECRVSSCFLER